LKSAKSNDTQARLDMIEKALVLYTIQNGCLPCPAGTAAPISGQSLANGAVGYTAQCADDAAATCASSGGVVPWVTLGLSEADATDGWGRLITYVVTLDLAVDSNSMVRTPPSDYPDGELDVWDADPTTAAADSVLTSAAAYVLISHGDDGYGGITPAGTTVADPSAGANVVQVDNATRTCDDTTNPCHQDDAYDINNDDKFDDVVRWRTAPLIIQQCGGNACGNPA
jgi:hypothetical protein